MCVFPGGRKVMFILCGNFKLLFYLRKSFKYLFLFISTCSSITAKSSALLLGVHVKLFIAFTCILKNIVCS